MTNDLKVQLQSAVSDVFASDDAADRAIMHVRRRRRLAAGATAVVGVAAAIAIPIVIASTTDSQGRPARILPIAPPAPTLSPAPSVGAQEITPLGPPVTVTGSGVGTVELGPVPANASSIDIRLICLSAGRFTLTGGTSIGCDASDVGNPRGASITYPYAMPLASGQHSITVTADPRSRWRLTARYASVHNTPWGVNADGQTYGTANSDGTPDLIAVIATNGRVGYAYASQIGRDAGPQPANPSQALAWQKTPLVTVHFPVYLSDGKTRIGQLDEQTNQAYVRAAGTGALHGDAVACWGPGPAPAHVSVTVTVVDSLGHRFAQRTLHATGSAADGPIPFSFTLPAGRYTVSAPGDFSKTVEVTAGKTSTVMLGAGCL